MRELVAVLVVLSWGAPAFASWQPARQGVTAPVPPLTDADERARQATYRAFKAGLGAMDRATAKSLLGTESNLFAFVDAWTAAEAAIVDQWFPSIRLVEVTAKGDAAIYEMQRVTAGVLQSYTIMFVKDADGVWRLR